MSSFTLWHAQRFYETLAKIIGEREGVEITVKVTPKDEVAEAEKRKENKEAVS